MRINKVPLVVISFIIMSFISNVLVMAECAVVEISKCEIKDKILHFEGKLNIKESKPVTIMAKRTDNPSDVKYLKVIKTDELGEFRGDVEIYDPETVSEFFEMEILFQADEDTQIVTLNKVYFNETQKQLIIDALNKSNQKVLEFITSSKENMTIFENMGIWIDLYDLQDSEIKDKINIAMDSYKSSITKSNIVEIVNGTIGSIIANNMDIAELEQLIIDLDSVEKGIYINKTAISLSEKFSEMDINTRQWIVSNIISEKPESGFANRDGFLNAIKTSMFLKIANDTHYMQLYDLILSNVDILEDNMDDLKNQKNKKIIERAMSAVKTQASEREFTSIDVFVGFVKEALKNAVKNETNNTSTGGSGTSNSGAGSNTKFSLITTPLENKSSGELITSFRDLNGYEWADVAIKSLVSKAILNGVGDGIFEPGRSVTREEFVKILCEGFGFGKSSSVGTFDDVKMDDWFAPYVSIAVELGIVDGISDKMFGTGNNITRQDMATMIYRALKIKGYNRSVETAIFHDESDISDYAKQAVSILSNEGIIEGTGNGLFEPKKNAIRAEAAVIIYRCIKHFSL